VHHERSIDSWFSGAENLSVRAVADDAGTGVAEFLLEGPGLGTTHPTGCAVPPDVKRRCRQHFDGPAATYSAGALPEGISTLSLRARDAAGSLSPVAAHAQWNIKVDRTAPQWPQGLGVQATHDATAQATVVDWLGAEDPDAANGTPLSGVASYRGRYRVAQSDQWTEFSGPEPELRLVQRPHPESFVVELSAVDYAGNATEPVTVEVAATSATAADQCRESDKGAYPSSCLDPSANYVANDDPEEVEEVEFEPEADPTARTPANRYRIGIDAEDCEERRLTDHPCLTTVRNARQAYAIGSTVDRSVIGAIQKRRVERPGKVFPYYYLGDISNPIDPRRSYRGNCGWIRRSLAEDDPFSRSSSACEIDYEPNIRNFSRRVNCRTLGCDHGTAILLEHPSPACANVFPAPAGKTDGCNWSLRTIAAGTCVEWRYVTTDNQFVMVKDRRFDLWEGSWVFIRRSALEADFRRWPNITTKGRGRCTNDGKLLPPDPDN